MSIKEIIDSVVDDSFANDFFNLAAQSGYILETVESIISKTGIGIDYIGCAFPDYDSPDDYDHFEGVCFIINEEEKNFSEEKSVMWAKKIRDKLTEPDF